jgi:hypothetical protein
VAGGPQEPLARVQAEAVGDQNFVAGQPANIQDADISFSYPTAEEPQITVAVQRAQIPTLFAKMFGVFNASVKATAMAEAYNPSGGDTNVSTGCMAPFMVPNCDPNPNAKGPAPNPNCAGDNLGHSQVEIRSPWIRTGNLNRKKSNCASSWRNFSVAGSRCGQ